MPFELTNSPANPIDLMMRVFRPYLEFFATVCTGVIVVCSRNKKMCVQRLRVVLKTYVMFWKSGLAVIFPVRNLWCIR